MSDRLPLFDGLEAVKVVRSLEEIRNELGDCTRCDLHRTRRNIVYGSGSPTARIVFVGEAPGETEDEQGLPFVGRAGGLLDELLANYNLRREDIYIANIIKCRPPKNRNPQLDEIAHCQPFLEAQIESIQPKIIIALGTFAAQWLAASDLPIGKLRGRALKFKDVRVVATYHPAYVLRNPDARRYLWADVGMALSLAK